MNRQAQNQPSRLKVIALRWLLGIDTVEGVSTPIKRWIVRPIKKGVSFCLLGIISIYVVLCLWDGYAWSTQISPSYGLILIRMIVVIVLAIIDAVVLPFRAGAFLLFAFLNAAILLPFIGILHGLSLSPAGENQIRRERNPIPTVLFIGGIAVLAFSFGNAVIQGDYLGFIDGYIFSSAKISFLFVLGLLLWVGRNIYISIQARHTYLFPQEETPIQSENTGSSQKTKKCPYCDEENLDNAIICRNCAKQIG